MKKTLTLSLITGCLLLMGALGTSAATPGKETTASSNSVEKQNVRRQIANNISCPGFVEDNSPTNDVRAIVQVDQNGKVSVTDINSANPRLLEYVTAQLQNMTVKNTGAADKFIFIIRFKVE